MRWSLPQGNLEIAEISNREHFIKHLNLHSQRKTTYLEMSPGLADL